MGGAAMLRDAYAPAFQPDLRHPAANPARGAGLDAEAMGAQQTGAAGGGVFHPAAGGVWALRGGLRDRALSAGFRSDVPQRERSYRRTSGVHGERRDHVVADPEPASGAAAALLPDADPLSVPADDPDDRRGRADHARLLGGLSLVSRGRASVGPTADGRSDSRRPADVGRAGHLPDVRIYRRVLSMVAARR